jgi:hypothetical protein
MSCDLCYPPTNCTTLGVLPNDTAQLSGSELLATKSSATVYFAANQTGQIQFKSGADYMQYKKARTLAGSSSFKGLRPAPSSAVAQLQAAGCPQ